MRLLSTAPRWPTLSFAQETGGGVVADVGGGFAAPDLFPLWRFAGSSNAECSGSLVTNGPLQDDHNNEFLTEAISGGCSLVDGFGPMGQRVFKTPFPNSPPPGGSDQGAACTLVLTSGVTKIYVAFLFMIDTDTENTIKIFRLKDVLGQSVCTPGLGMLSGNDWSVGLDNWSGYPGGDGQPTQGGPDYTIGTWVHLEQLCHLISATSYRTVLYLNGTSIVDFTVDPSSLSPSSSGFTFRRVSINGTINKPIGPGNEYWTDFAASTQRIGMPSGFVP